MTKPYLIPYKAEHLMSIVDRDGLDHNWDSARYKAHFPAFTAIISNDLIGGCAGIMIPWRGYGMAWVTLTKEIAPHMLWVTRTVKHVLRDIKRSHKLHRIDLGVLEGIERNIFWAKFLGFTREENGIARKYTPDQQNILRFEMIS